MLGRLDVTVEVFEAERDAEPEEERAERAVPQVLAHVLRQRQLRHLGGVDDPHVAVAALAGDGELVDALLQALPDLAIALRVALEQHELDVVAVSREGVALLDSGSLSRASAARAPGTRSAPPCRTWRFRFTALALCTGR